MADLIATEAFAKNIGGANISYISNLGCTKSKAIALGCKVARTYTNNQLVCQKDLSTPGVTSYSLRNNSIEYFTNVKIYAGNCIFSGNFPAGGILYNNAAPSGSSWTITINGSISTAYKVEPSPSSTNHYYIFFKR